MVVRFVLHFAHQSLFVFVFGQTVLVACIRERFFGLGLLVYDGCAGAQLLFGSAFELASLLADAGAAGRPGLFGCCS